MADASGAIDAAVEAARKAVSGKLRRGDEFTTDDVIVVSVKAAARVLLAAERDRIAQAIDEEAESREKRAWDDQFDPDEREDQLKYLWGVKVAAEIARGSVAGKPDTQGGQS